MSIAALSAKLRLAYTRECRRQLVDEARQTKQNYADFLANLLESEWQLRLNNGQQRRLKEAKFPFKKYLVDFKREKYDALFLPKFEELDSLAFIEKKENIILIGTPGAGKTHYSIALGIAACMKGHSVLFASVPNLVVELKETMQSNQLSSFRKRFEKYDLVILDEPGYVSMDKIGRETLFRLISSRNEKGSIIVNSNLTFERWEDIFKDPTLTSAIIDRLARKAHVLDISRDKGGRFEETIAWIERAKQ